MSERFFADPEYLKLKSEYEKKLFKLFGKYCNFTPSGKVEYKTSQEVMEYFKNKVLTVSFEKTTYDKKGKSTTETIEIKRSFYDVWSVDPAMAEFEEIVFECNALKVLPKQFNMFRGCGYHLKNTPVDDTINLYTIFDHIRSLVNYNEEHFEYVLNFYAQMIQQPHIIPSVCLVFISDEGVGKDKHAGFIANMIGQEYYVNTAKIEQLTGKFNSLLGGKLLVVINEANPVETRERVEIIKEITTAETLTIEAKHKDPTKVENYARFIFFSNKLTAFPLDEGSRRPIVFQSSSKYTKDVIGADGNKAYFGPLIDMYKDEKYQKKFLEFLRNRDISKWNPQAFEKSALHKQLEEHSRNPLVDFLANIVNLHKDEVSFTMFASDALETYNELVKAHKLKYEYTLPKFNLELKNKFKVKEGKNSKTTLIFNIGEIKEILEKKYSYCFDEKTKSYYFDEKKDDVEPEEGLKDDMSVRKTLDEEIEHYSKLLEELKKKKLAELDKLNKQRKENLKQKQQSEKPTEIIKGLPAQNDEEDEKIKKIKKIKKMNVNIEQLDKLL